jgi:putative hydrolase of the HAD superfamily
VLLILGRRIILEYRQFIRRTFVSNTIFNRTTFTNAAATVVAQSAVFCFFVHFFGRTRGSSADNGKDAMGDTGNGRSNNLKAVIFDYGEVLCHRPTEADHARLASFFRLSVDELPELWERNRGPFDRGDLTPEVYWNMLAKDARTEITAQQLQEICDLDTAMWSNVNTGMVEWAQQLGSTGLKIGLLSNMHPAMVTYCREHFSWLKNFDFLTFSGDVRLIKPDPAIYEHTLHGLGVKANEALFLDDREVNVQAARKLGIHAFRFQSAAQLRNDLQGIGFPFLLPQL